VLHVFHVAIAACVALTLPAGVHPWCSSSACFSLPAA
jgi:hypothetical protein